MGLVGRLSPALVTIAAAAAVVAAQSAAGQFHPWISPDTPSFLAAAASDAPLAEMRLPLYGWIAAAAVGSPAALVVLVWIQLTGFVAASVWLVVALQRLGVSRAGCQAVGLSLAISNVLILWSVAVLPEAVGHAALLAAFAAVTGIAAGLPAGRRIVLAGIAVTAAWALRSSLLPFILLVPLLLPMLPGRPARRLRLTLLLLAACLGPALGLSAWRAAQVGDFNVVSFGGFQMSGMAALMLTPEIAKHLPATERAVAESVIARRTELEAAGQAIAIPANSTGRHSFSSVALFYFDILARSHDAVLYGAVAPLRLAAESWPSFNGRMQRLALATIKAAPVEYAAWVIGATARLLGHAMALNGAFVAGCLALLLRIRRAPAETPSRSGGRDLPALLAISVIYLAGTASLVILTTFPASRYIDSAGLFLPVWPFYAALRQRG